MGGRFAQPIRPQPIGQRARGVKDGFHLGRQPARTRSRLPRSGTGEAALGRDGVRNVPNDRIGPVNAPGDRPLHRQRLERAEAAQRARDDSALVQVELGEPPERIAAQREPIAERGSTRHARGATA